MKLFKNGSMYLEKKDMLFVGILPKAVVDEMPDEPMSDNTLIVFESKGAIAFWRGRKEILDYNVVRKLSDKEIQGRILKIVHEIIYLNVKIGNSSREKQIEIGYKIKTLEYMKETYEKYLSNRKAYDSRFEHLN